MVMSMLGAWCSWTMPPYISHYRYTFTSVLIDPAPTTVQPRNADVMFSVYNICFAIKSSLTTCDNSVGSGCFKFHQIRVYSNTFVFLCMDILTSISIFM